jgi:hypothetical protein
MNAKETIMKPSTIAKTLTIAAVTALVLGIGPRAKADGRRCSEANLRGTFAFNSSQNGSVGPGTATGTYTVNDDDCTGTFTETSDGFTAHFSFAIDKSGEEFQAICQDTGVVVTRIGRR